MVTSPHDALFKAAFGRADIAQSELEFILPASLRAKLDLGSLTLRPGSYIDEELRDSHSDLLYEVRTVSEATALVFILFEHQSTFDPDMPFRCLKYAVRIWEAWRIKHPGKGSKLPILVSVVLHHGAEGWRARPELASMFDADAETIEATRRYVPHFELVVDDIASLSLEDLAKRTIHVLGRLVQIAFWTARSMDRFEEAKPLMRELAKTTTRDESTRILLTQLYVYLLRVLKDVDVFTVYTKLLEVAGTEGKEDVMTAGDQLINMGIEKGLADGLAKGLADGLAKGLADGRAKGLADGRADGFRAAITKLLSVRKITLTEAGRARLEACSDAKLLEQWYERAITAAAEAEIFGA